MDEDGFLYVVGRRKDIVKVGGFRVSVKEIEEAILEISEVHEVAVIGVEDPVLGEAIKAFIVCGDENLKEKQVVQFIGKRLPAYKLPKYFEFCTALPKNESGKIIKTGLK